MLGLCSAIGKSRNPVHCLPSPVLYPSDLCFFSCWCIPLAASLELFQCPVYGIFLLKFSLIYLCVVFLHLSLRGWSQEKLFSSLWCSWCWCFFRSPRDAEENEKSYKKKHFYVMYLHAGWRSLVCLIQGEKVIHSLTQCFSVPLSITLCSAHSWWGWCSLVMNHHFTTGIYVHLIKEIC